MATSKRVVVWHWGCYQGHQEIQHLSAIKMTLIFLLCCQAVLLGCVSASFSDIVYITHYIFTHLGCNSKLGVFLHTMWTSAWCSCHHVIAFQNGRKEATKVFPNVARTHNNLCVVVPYQVLHLVLLVCFFFPLAIYTALLNNEKRLQNFILHTACNFFLIPKRTFLSVSLLKLLTSLGNNPVPFIIYQQPFTSNHLPVAKPQAARQPLSSVHQQCTYTYVLLSSLWGDIWRRDQEWIVTAGCLCASFSNLCYQTGNLISLPPVTMLNRKI